MSYKLPDFDTLLAIAQRDPSQLDAIKQTATEALINGASLKHQRRLRGLQFQIDMEVRRARSPMDGCIRVSKMMHDKLWDLKAALNLKGVQMAAQQTANGAGQQQTETQAQRNTEARILPFNQGK